MSNLKSILLMCLLLTSSVFALNTKEIIKSEAKLIEAAIGTDKELDKKKLKSYLSSNYEDMSNEYQNYLVKKASAFPAKTRAQRTADLIFSTKKSLKPLQPCYSVTDQCKKGTRCAAPLKGPAYEVCLIEKNAQQTCKLTTDICLSGDCQKMTRYTDLNVCKTESQSCRSNSDCCSKQCDSNTKLCIPEFKCSSCIGIGSRPDKGQECCTSLYKNTNGICTPIMPGFGSIFNLDILLRLIPVARAEDEGESINGNLSTLTNLLIKNGITGSSNTKIISNYEDDKKDCDDMSSSFIHRSQKEACYKSLSNKVKSEIAAQSKFASKANEADVIIDKFQKELEGTKSPLSQDSSFDKWRAPLDAAVNKCVSSEAGDINKSSNSRLSAIGSCVDNTKELIKDKIMEEEYKISTGIVSDLSSDSSLYEGSNDIPLFSKIHQSDVGSCRVNLFGDFLAAQSNDYFEILMMMMAMDYTTGGKDNGDFFHIKSQYNTAIAPHGSYTGTTNEEYNWNMQTNWMRPPNLNSFDPAAVGRGNNKLWDTYDPAIGEAALKTITDYLAKLSEDDKKIFMTMFYNGKLNSQQKNKFLQYFVTDEKKHLDEFSDFNPKAGAGKYNIRDVVRFEAIKFKMGFYKLYGKLHKRSLEMMCRCVDTLGPMNDEKWLQDDVKENYLNNCNGLGKYDTFVIDNDKKVCEGDDCRKVSDKDFGKHISDKEKELHRANGGPSNEKKNSVGNTVVTNNGYNLEERKKDYFVTSLEEVTACIGDGVGCNKTSRYNDFVKGNTVSFKEEREQTAKGHGQDLALFLRDMTLMKIRAIEEATLANITSGSELFMHTVTWMKQYSWNQTKLDGERYTKTKKCYYPVCFILQNLKFLGSFMNKMLAGLTNIMTGGIFLGGDLSLNLPSSGTNNICGPRTKKTWKKSKIPVGKKYTIKCMRFHLSRNDVCNKKLAASSCTRNVYMKNVTAGAKEKLLDPFLPDMSGNYSTEYISASKIPYNGGEHVTQSYHQYSGNVSNYYKDHAKGFFLASLISTDNGDEEENQDRIRMANEFANYAYNFHFRAPKVTERDYYITPGLIPYFELLMAKMNNYMGQTLANLSRSAAYALRMHNYYHIVKDGMQDSTVVNRDMSTIGLPNVEFQGDFAQFTNWLSGFETAGNPFEGGRINDDFFTEKNNEFTSTGSKSPNARISGVSKIVRKTLGDLQKKRRENQLMRDTLKKRGRAGDFDKLNKMLEGRSAAQSASIAGIVDSYRNSIGGGPNSSRSKRGDQLSNINQDFSTGFSQEALDIDSNKKNGKSSKNGNSLTGDGKNIAVAKAGDGEEVITFDDLDDIEGLYGLDDETLVRLGDRKMKAKILKKHIAKAIEENQLSANHRKHDKEWERDGISIFDIISKRYEISAFPKVLKN